MPSESPRLAPLYGFIPLVVLGALVIGFFFALTRIVPSYVGNDAFAAEGLPPIVALLPALSCYPFLSSLGVLVVGGLAFVLGPKEHPLRITAWYLAGAFLLTLWGVILILVPQTHSNVGVPLL